MSDMQKGLHLALIDLLPNAEIRWASIEVLLQSKLHDMSELGEGIVEALLKYNKEAWCRAFFEEHSKCDVVENNTCETLNSWILGARFKSIITMLEEIRIKTFGHNKKGCPALKNAGTSYEKTSNVVAGTSVVTAGTNVATSDCTNAAN
ncbi:hypothetical protein H5410_027670 [Solanum commersonii]|uniref:Uncharacterized protein n=1 Tax=Solanum commersonii TaxID=4109 RepID=A0A9J5Z0I8_SOLCO|nr:hypothetical protein H5410_027670 [Solanum commersonii]